MRLSSVFFVRRCYLRRHFLRRPQNLENLENNGAGANVQKVSEKFFDTNENEKGSHSAKAPAH